ncbi:MAG TPA: sigma-70 family RNA polymerase sigma factor [Polyangiaceae bacterium]|nr:sigma-70 family RNA polymerase sigma factor [Polyangiaceae bacterium]
MPEPATNSDATTVSDERVRLLVKSHRDFLGFLERRLGNRALAEDLLQEAFVRGIHKLDTLHDEEAAVAWFYRVLRNAITDHHRRTASTQRKLEAFAAELQEPPSTPAETHAAVCRCVGGLAAALKPEYSDALRQVEIEGRSIQDYATEAGITSNNARVRVFRAREALRREVTRCCGSCAEHGCLDCTCGA